MKEQAKEYYLIWWIISLVHLFVLIVFNMERYPYLWLGIYSFETIFFAIAIYQFKEYNIIFRATFIIISPVTAPIAFTLGLIISVLAVPWMYIDDRKGR